ncbi:MAG: helix-turn-helix transcriptional regulator [Candidatus Poribacteria bacterium]|nr:helix-turn-helix transcriptional regulator [Candidatus Poribacteria bacterium]
MSTGKIIAEYRKKNGLTQEQLAEKIHTSRQTIAMWETERQLPSDNVAILAGRILEINEKELFAQLAEDRLHQRIDRLQRTHDVTITIEDEGQKRETQDLRRKLTQTNDEVTLTITRIYKSIYWDEAHEALFSQMYRMHGSDFNPPMGHSNPYLFLHLLCEDRNRHLDLLGIRHDIEDNLGNIESERLVRAGALSSTHYYIEDNFGNRPRGMNLWRDESDDEDGSRRFSEIIRSDYPLQGTEFTFHRDFVNHHQDDCDAILFEDIPIDGKGITKSFKNAVIRYDGIRENEMSNGNAIHLVHNNPLEVRYLGIRQVVDNLGNTYTPYIKGHFHPRRSDLGGYLEYFTLKELNPNATTISFKYLFARTILSFEFSDLPLP